MKNLRKMVLLLAVAAVAMTAQYSFAQQEVDPDHYDQPIVARASAKAGTQKHVAARPTHAKANVASHKAKQQPHPNA